MRISQTGGACALALLVSATPAFAGGKLDLGHGFKADWKLNASAGTAIRLGTRSTNQIVYKPDAAGTRRNIPKANAAGKPGNVKDANSDDGDLNYNKGDFTDGNVQAYGSFNLHHKHFGVLVSAMAWYNYVKANETVLQGNAANGYKPNAELSDSGFPKRAKFAGAVFKQAYGYAHFKPYGHSASIKVGKQLVLWGRSMFSRGALTSLNAINLPAYHRPGSTYQEFLTPAAMVKFNLDVTQHLKLKTFYQFEWQKATTDGCGTYQDVFDNVSPGCNPTFTNQALPIGPGGAGVYVTNRFAYQHNLYFHRGPDRHPSNGGQYGIKLNYGLEQGKAHVGGYFFNYNFRLPIYSLHRNTAAQAGQTGTIAPFKNVNIFYEYPQNVKVYGLTADKLFSNVGRVSFNFSYIPNEPIQLNTPDITNALADAANPQLQAAGLAPNPQNDPRIPNGTARLANSIAPGGDLHGYKKYKVLRQQMHFDTIIPNLMKANKTVVSLALAFEEIPNLPSKSKYRFNRYDNFGLGGPGANGYTTNFSWGYKIKIQPTYKNAIGKVTLKPSLIWQQGVQGHSSDQALEANQTTLSLGLGAEYKHLSGNIDYTHYNTSKYSVLEDRDYMSLSASYSF